MRKTVVVLIALVMLWALALPAMAQEEEVRLDLDFRGETLDNVLQLFRRGYGLEYTLGEGVNPNMQITTHLRGVTLDQALQSILNPNGLLAIEQDGRYVIRERPQPTERSVETRVVTPAFGAEGRTPPPPTRTAQAYEPRRGAAADAEGDEEERDEVMEIIWPMYLGADMASSIFGGGFVEAGGYYGGGSGYGGGGSYGRGGSYGGSYGSSYGSSYGGSRTSNFGSSRSSNLGSSRNTGFGTNY